jgi:hypothetical protein
MVRALEMTKEIEDLDLSASLLRVAHIKYGQECSPRDRISKILESQFYSRNSAALRYWS